MRRLWAHVALALVGLLAAGWALTLSAQPTIMCRDDVMAPGDVCSNAEGTRVQTYEERWQAAQSARPVVGGVGAAVAVFGSALAAAELAGAGRRGRS